MPRDLSTTAILSAQDVETEEIWLVLMEINHDDLVSPFYLVNNTESITHTDPESLETNDYLAYPFNIVLGNDDGTKLPTVKLTFDNVDQALVQVIREVSDSPDINIKVVLASQPNTIEIEISELKLREVSYDAYTITGTLYADDILNQRWPKDNITKAAGYLGLFR